MREQQRSKTAASHTELARKMSSSSSCVCLLQVRTDRIPCGSLDALLANAPFIACPLAVVALTLFDLRRRGMVGRIALADINGGSWCLLCRCSVYNCNGHTVQMSTTLQPQHRHRCQYRNNHQALTLINGPVPPLKPHQPMCVSVPEAVCAHLQGFMPTQGHPSPHMRACPAGTRMPAVRANIQAKIGDVYKGDYVLSCTVC